MLDPCTDDVFSRPLVGKGCADQSHIVGLRTAGGKEDFLFLYLQGLCDLGSGIFYILLCLHSLSVAGRGISVILCHKLHRQVLYFI